MDLYELDRKGKLLLVAALILSAVASALIAVMVMLNFNSDIELGKYARSLVVECESDKPRNQNCKLDAVLDQK